MPVPVLGETALPIDHSAAQGAPTSGRWLRRGPSGPLRPPSAPVAPQCGCGLSIFFRISLALTLFSRNPNSPGANPSASPNTWG
jgi:hypothetical protein